jgi:hypothetical protein
VLKNDRSRENSGLEVSRCFWFVFLNASTFRLFRLFAVSRLFQRFFLKKDLKTTPLPTCSRGNQLAGLAIFSVVTVAMLGI